MTSCCTFCLCFIVCASVVCTCVCSLVAQSFLSSIWKPLSAALERRGSRVAQANGQLMGSQTARLVPKCPQIKQFIWSVCTHIHTETHMQTGKQVYTPTPPRAHTHTCTQPYSRNRPVAYHSVHTDSSVLLNTQLTTDCVWRWWSVSLAVCFTWRPAVQGMT